MEEKCYDLTLRRRKIDFGEVKKTAKPPKMNKILSRPEVELGFHKYENGTNYLDLSVPYISL
jgi:hypothetical protein